MRNGTKKVLCSVRRGTDRIRYGAGESPAGGFHGRALRWGVEAVGTASAEAGRAGYIPDQSPGHRMYMGSAGPKDVPVL